jgi:VWFA-related protein
MQRRRKLLLCALFLLLSAEFSFAQQQDASKTQSNADVLRINTDLVQTAVTVFDSKGRFVDGLTKEDFALEVDGQPVSISFFENIVAGSSRDRLVRTAGQTESAPGERSAISIRRRAIVFFIDDRHLSLDSVGRTRKTLLGFIDQQMGPNDVVAIASASGQIGFLQQFTDNKEVLRAAVARLRVVPYVVTDYGQNPGAPMTEYMALTIERKDDPQVFEFYVQDCMKWKIASPGTGSGISRVQCEVEVKNRARQILIQAATVTKDTYYSLEELLRSAERMPGSKLAFFISDGFLMETGPRAPIAINQLGRITNEARRAGVVIYTIDARGLIAYALDATGNIPFDAGGMLENAGLRAIPATQDALNALAGDTGGRALRNQNTFDQFITQALTETSRYYLIAWRPEAADQKSPKYKNIKVSVRGRPELTVRSARGFTNAATKVGAEQPSTKETGKTGRQKQPDADLQGALSDFYPKHALPLDLSLIYLDTPASGAMLTTSVQAPANALFYGEEGKDPAHLTIAGVILDDQGKPAGSFGTKLEVKPRPTENAESTAWNVIYNSPVTLKPGIYQVRVAARDDARASVGSALQWIVIPDLSKRQLALSSLLVGFERVTALGSPNGDRGQWSVDRKFSPGSHVKFLTFVYNAAAAGGSGLAAQVRVYRDGRAVISKPIPRAATIGDLDPARIPFTSELDLQQLQPGTYVLEVTVEDLVAHQTASQQTTFYVQ